MRRLDTYSPHEQTLKNPLVTFGAVVDGFEEIGELARRNNHLRYLFTGDVLKNHRHPLLPVIVDKISSIRLNY